MKRPSYIIAGLIAIAISYVSARLGVNRELDMLGFWHAVASFAFGFGGGALILSSFMDDIL